MEVVYKESYFNEYGVYFTVEKLKEGNGDYVARLSDCEVTIRVKWNDVFYNEPVYDGRFGWFFDGKSVDDFELYN